jgi:hypothetical protein
MIPVATADQLVAALRQSNLLPAGRIDGWLDDNPAATAEPPRALADRLVAAGLLTRFQARLLLKGRPGEAFIGGKYKVLDLLGKGGMGAVYLCEHVALRTRVAVKVLPASADEDPQTRERFYREARAFAQLNHPNLVRGFDVDSDGTSHYIVMEYVDGVDLQRLVAQGGPLDVGRAANYVRQAATGLAHAHQRGWVHRDVKPANIAVDRTGLVRVLDMGLARTVLEGRDAISRNFDDGFIRGTADYLSPEQADGAALDGRCDIYSLGVTLYFLLTSRLPFEAANTAQKLVAHLIKTPHPIRTLRPDLPEGLAQVVEVMMAKEPEFRYQTGADVAAALAPWDRGPSPPAEYELPGQRPAAGSEPAAAGTPTPGPTAPLSRPIAPPPRRPRNRLAVAGLLGVAAVAVGAVVALWRQEPPLRNGPAAGPAPTASPFMGHYVPVTRAHGPNQTPFPGGHAEYLTGRVYESVKAALSDPRVRDDDNCRILLLDAVHQEQAEIDVDSPKLPPGIAIESARANPPTEWIPPEGADPAKPLLLLRGGARLAVRNLTFNGHGKFETPVAWHEPGPGCQLHAVRVTGFTGSGVALRSPAGRADEPVQLSRVRIDPGSSTPVAACVAGAAPGGTAVRNLRLTDCRLEGPASQGVLLAGRVEAFEMARCRLFKLQNGVRFAGPGKFDGVLADNTTARVTVPVWLDLPPPIDPDDRLRLRGNLFFEATTAVRFANTIPAPAKLFDGSEGNWCNEGGCLTPTPGLPVAAVTNPSLGLEPDNDAEFLRYPAAHRLATAGPGGRPVGVPPVK